MKRFIVIFLLPAIITYSQTDTTITIENIVSDLLEDASEDIDDNYLLDLLEDLKDNPVNINIADVDELMKIPFLDFNSAQKIIKYRERFGDYFSTKELFAVDGLSEYLASALQPFTIHRERYEEKLFTTEIYSIELRSRLINDLQERRGFTENKYLGNTLKSYQRAKLNFGKIYLNGLVEKDAGEEKYNDFVSYSFSIKNYKFIKNITAGDYLIEFGQGLILWGPYSFGKGSEAIRSVTKAPRTIRSYTSTDENQFFRGGAAAIELNPFTITAFYSDHNIDANVDSTTNRITSFPVTGYHRTGSEIAKLNIVNERTYGTIVNLNPLPNLNLGFSYHNITYDKALQDKDIFSPSGNNFNFYSASYSYMFNNFRLSGETAYNSISVASLNNLEWIITDRIQFITSLRNYPRNFYSFKGTGFGESSNTQNEFGIYNGIRWRSDFGILNFYFDQFRFPYSSYYSPLPSKGNEYLIDFTTRPFTKTLLGFRAKRENKEVSETIDDSKFILNQIKTNYRMSFEYYPIRELRLKTRFEYVTFEQEKQDINEKGFLIFQDFRYDPNEQLRFYGRIVLCQTDSYDSRVYQFENDVRGTMFNPALYGKGLRWYFIFEYTPFNFIRLSAKYSELYKPDERVLGSGLNEIQGNLDNRITFQLDVKF